MIQIDTIPIVCKFPVKYYAKIEWPSVVKMNGIIYARSGVEGKRIGDDMPGARYENREHGQLWLYVDGTLGT